MQQCAGSCGAVVLRQLANRVVKFYQTVISLYNTAKLIVCIVTCMICMHGEKHTYTYLSNPTTHT